MLLSYTKSCFFYPPGADRLRLVPQQHHDICQLGECKTQLQFFISDSCKWIFCPVTNLLLITQLLSFIVSFKSELMLTQFNSQNKLSKLLLDFKSSTSAPPFSLSAWHYSRLQCCWMLPVFIWHVALVSNLILMHQGED